MRSWLALCLLVSSSACATATPVQPAPPPPDSASRNDKPLVIAEAPEPEPATVEPPTVEPEPEPEPVPPSADPPSDAALDSNPPAPPAVKSDVRDPRRLATAPRARALLITELQALERLLAATPKSSKDRVLLLHRLAEGYVELEYTVAGATDAQSVKLLAASRKQAISHYREIRAKHATYPKMDDVLYYLGYEYERAKDSAHARALYRELFTRFPQSPFVARVPRALKPR